MTNRRNHDDKQAREPVSAPGRPTGTSRYESERVREVFRNASRHEPSSFAEKQRIRLDNDLYERQSS